MKCPVLSCIGLLLLLLLVVGVTVGVRDPYTMIETSTAEVKQGVRVDGSYLKDIGTGDYFGFKQLNFSQETVAFEWIFFNNAAYDSSHQVSLRLDSPTTAPFLTRDILPSHWFIQSTQWIAVDQRPRGVHDLYFTFQHSGGLQLSWFNFVSLESLLPTSTTLYPNATTAIDCPPPVTCPSAESSVHPSEPRHVSVERYDNDTRTHKYFNIYINQTLYL